MLRSKFNTIEPIQYMPALNQGRLFYLSKFMRRKGWKNGRNRKWKSIP